MHHGFSYMAQESAHQKKKKENATQATRDDYDDSDIEKSMTNQLILLFLLFLLSPLTLLVRLFHKIQAPKTNVIIRMRMKTSRMHTSHLRYF